MKLVSELMSHPVYILYIYSRGQKYSTTSLLCIRILRCNWHNINNISINQNQLEQDELLSVCSGIHTVF